MANITNSAIKWTIYAALLAWVAVLLSQKIDLTTADLGRHITNGSMILRSAADRNGVLHTNFYSYTMPDQPFINHHWLSGVAFYLIWRAFGFTGLSVWNVLFGVMAFGLFFDVARRAGKFWLAAAISFAVMPLITARSEVRPETFTYFLTGFFAWTLWLWRAGRIGRRWLYGLPPLMLLWVNLHIGFVFGFLALGAFLLEASLPFAWLRIRPNRKVGNPSSKSKTSGKEARHSVARAGKTTSERPELLQAGQTEGLKQLATVSGLCAVAGLVNPFFLQGFLYPLSIFEKYGYTIAENQSIPFLERLGLGGNQIFLLFRLTAGAIIVSCLLVAIGNFRKLDVALLTPALASGAMAYFAIRNFITFALFVVPALTGAVSASGTSSSGKRISLRDSILISIAVVAVAAALLQQYQEFAQMRPTLGLGLLPGVEASADFLRENHIAGPIFNDYDTGGYLIYKLSLDGQSQKVFVDNRPEAYTVEFFHNVYIPAQQDELRWRQMDNLYHFNVIFFSHRDNTPWGRTFLVARAKDSAWVPVFADSYNVIFLRRDNPANAEIIKKHAIAVRVTN
jgi:MFS family permease